MTVRVTENDDFGTLRVERAADRVVVTLNRPAVRNAVNLAMVQELHEVCRLVEGDPTPVVFTGAGGTFASGADIAELRDRGRDGALAGINSTLFDRIARLPQPTIAAVDGPALGGGAELSYACDIRLASTTAVFGNPEPGLGIIAGAGACWRLAELVGRSAAKQVLLGGATFDAQRAFQLGLVADVVDADELLPRAHALVDRIVRSSATALRLTKLVVDAPGAHPLADDLAQAVLFDSADKQQRMTAFLERKGR